MCTDYKEIMSFTYLGNGVLWVIYIYSNYSQRNFFQGIQYMWWQDLFRDVSSDEGTSKGKPSQRWTGMKWDTGGDKAFLELGPEWDGKGGGSTFPDWELGWDGMGQVKESRAGDGMGCV